MTELTAGIDPTLIARTAENAAAEGILGTRTIRVAPAMRHVEQFDADAVLLTSTLTINNADIERFRHFATREMEFIPENYFYNGEDIVLPLDYFDENTLALYSAGLRHNLCVGRLQPIERGPSFEVYRLVSDEAPHIILSDYEGSVFDASFGYLQRILSSNQHFMHEATLKQSPIGCPLYQMIKHGVVRIAEHTVDHKKLMRTDKYSTYGLPPVVYYSSRDWPELDAMFGSDEEIKEAMKEEKAKSLRDTLRFCNHFTVLGDGFVELYSTQECEWCGMQAVDGRQEVLSIPPEFLVSMNFHQLDEAPAEGYVVEVDDDDGHRAERFLCSICDPNEE